jgi:hypothetical protein
MRFSYEQHGMLRALAATIFLIFCPQSADCQSAAGKDSRFEIFLQGGAAVYTDTSGSRLDAVGTPFTLRKSFAPSAQWSAGLRVRLSARNMLEVSFSDTISSVTTTLSTATIPVPVPSDMNVGMDSVHASYVRLLPRKGKWQFYFAGGMGLTVFTGAFRRETFPSGTFGAGVDLQLNKHFSIRLDQRFIITGAPRSTFLIDSPTFEVPGKTAMFAPSLGLVWRFR